MKEQLQNISHKRLNILTGAYVLVSPHRNKRPWQGKEDKIEEYRQKSYEIDCYLCPSNKRSSSKINPDYTDTFVFENDFAALQLKDNTIQLHNGLLKASTENGICKVICFSPDHSKSLAQMEVNQIEKVVSVWQSEYESLSQLAAIAYIQIFENKGSIMGCSNPHPHGQIWAQSSIPNEVLIKDKEQKDYFIKNKRSLLSDYLNQELELNERIIYQNEDFVVFVPFWAVWPFEAMIVPKDHQAHIGLLSVDQKLNFAEAIKVLTETYDQVFNCSFPYTSGIHQAPTNNKDQSHWHWHMSFYPPLLRSATVKKFMVGYEMFAMPQRDITAESAAEILKANLKLA